MSVLWYCKIQASEKYRIMDNIKIDIATFKELTIFYAADKNNVYYKGEVVEGADSRSFKLLKNKFAKDKTAYYYEGKKLEGVSDKEVEELMNSSKMKKSF